MPSPGTAPNEVTNTKSVEEESDEVLMGRTHVQANIEIVSTIITSASKKHPLVCGSS